ncbi:hypothetical protein ACFSTC_06635 [Nonomuraea ferruginea]
MIPPTPRLPEARALIDLDRYFVVHAPRQTGKTTALEALASELTAEGDTAALMFSCETAKAMRRGRRPRGVAAAGFPPRRGRVVGMAGGVAAAGSLAAVLSRQPSSVRRCVNGAAAARAGWCCSWTRSTASRATA